ncbi:oligosaccharyl transferase subunit ost3/OST6 [Chytridiales sp. JEL 0842]|nr:oligosaccharyl transferase subunit ost3/OST6 [Chytridiales sp. JEL 0842]
MPRPTPLLFILLLLSPLIHAYTSAYKIAKLEPLHKQSPKEPIKLDSKGFMLFTESPRNYSMFVVMTAMGPEFGCEPCRKFESEFKLLTQSWSRTKKSPGRAYFSVLDFKDGQDVYRQLKITAVPIVLHFPPTEGPNGRSIKEAYETYDLNRRGVLAENVASWIESTSGLSIPIRRPWDYTLIGTYTVLALSTLSILSALWRNISTLLSSKKPWMVFSLGLIVLFCSGHMWNSIRGAPYVGNRNGKPEIVAPGFQSQFVLESQIVAFLYAVSSLVFIMLAVWIPKMPAGGAVQKVGIYATVGAFLVVYSLLLKLFKVKNGGYPFALLL